MDSDRNNRPLKAMTAWCFLIFLSVAPMALSCAIDKPESTRSSPPDTTPYKREVVPEDYAPGGKEALPPKVTPKPQDAIKDSSLPDKQTAPDKSEPSKER